MRNKILSCARAAVLGCLIVVAPLWGYVLQTDDSGVYVVKWDQSPVNLQIKLSTVANLLDGNSQSSSVAAAARVWNTALGTVQLSTQPSSGAYVLGNGTNEVAMDSTIGGQAFSTGILAVTMIYARGDALTETDIIFNSAYTWNSYRGNLRHGTEDIQRVAMHEMGHVLGLDHPDEHGQYVTALMNSRESNLDTLQSDDIAGGQKLYGPPGFVPANDSFASAIAITLNDGTLQFTGSNIGATRETGEPDHADSTGIHSIWWKWTAPTNGRITVDTLGSNFDTALAIYTGTSVSALTSVVSNDDAESATDNPTPQRKRTSKVVFDAVIGTTYFIAVDGWGGGNSLPDGYTGSITLNLDFGALTPVITSATAVSVDAGQPFNFQIQATKSPTAFGASGLPTGLTLDTTTGKISGRPTVTGVFVVQLSATAALATGNATLVLTVKAAAPAIVYQPTGLQVVAPGGTLTMTVDTLSANGPVSFAWRRNGRVISGASGGSLVLTNAAVMDTGYYQVAISNAIGTTNAVIFVRVAPARTEFVGWGTNADGQLDLPIGFTRGSALSASLNYVVALTPDGAVTAWGNKNLYGPPSVPVGLGDVVMVAAGVDYTVALRADGTVFRWGGYSSLDIPIPTNLGGVMAIASGAHHVIALKTDGSIVAWGENFRGQCNVPASLGNVVAVAAGYEHSLALKADGTVVAWGGNYLGQCDVPVGLSGVVALAGGTETSVAVKSDGTLVTWGTGSYGNSKLPSGLSNVVTVAAGIYHTLALKTDGTVVQWGDSRSGAAAVPPAFLNKVFAMAAGNGFSCVLRDASADTIPVVSRAPSDQVVIEGNTANFSVTVNNGGAVNVAYQWRKNGQPITGATGPAFAIAGVTSLDAGKFDVTITTLAGVTTSAGATLTVKPLPVVINLSPVRQVVKAGDTLSLNVSATGTGSVSLQWYHDGRPISGATGVSYSHATTTRNDEGAYWVTATDSVGVRFGGPNFVVLNHPATNVVAWGTDVSGVTNFPVSLTTAVAVGTSSDGAGLALKSDGTVQAWGNMVFTGRMPAGLSNIVAIAVGRNCEAALRTDGTVILATQDGSDGTVAGLKNVWAIACGDDFIMALKTDGTLTTWSGSTYWNGSAYVSSSPPSAGLTDIVAIDAKRNNAMALKSDGTIVFSNGFVPFAPMSMNLGNVVAIATGGFVASVVKADGTVVAWFTLNPSASVSAGLSDIIAISAGVRQSIALKADGTVLEWGDANLSQSTIKSGLNKVFAIYAGDYTSWALCDVPDGQSAPITLQPQSQIPPAGSAASMSVVVSGNPAPTLQWQRNGTAIGGATTPTFAINDTQSASTGLYTVATTSGVTTTVSDIAILGLSSTSKVIGAGTELQPANLPHPNGNVFDQVLLNGAAESITADPNQVTRTSFIDLNDDIVQVEFGGAGTLSLVLDNPTGPAAPLSYNQPSVSYMKGHAGIVVVGANETTNLSVFSVGRATAFDPTGTFNFLQAISPSNNPANNGSVLFQGKGSTVDDGVADIAFIAILSSNGKFGGLRTSNTSYFATKGYTGVYAPGVQFTGPVYVGNISAFDAATPVLMIGSSPDTRITGGDLLQANGQSVKVSGLTQLKYTDGQDSNGHPQAAKANRAVLQQNGADVTAQVVVNPSP